MSIFCNLFNCVVAEVGRDIEHDLSVIAPEPLDELDDQGTLSLPVLASKVVVKQVQQLHRC